MPKTHTAHILIATIALGLLPPLRAYAASITWSGATGYDWHTGGNWVGGVVPDATDDVIIPSGGDQPIISNGDVTVHSLTIEAGASVTVSNDLTVTNAFENNGTVIVKSFTPTFDLTQDIDSGTWEFQQDDYNSFTARNLPDFGTTDYHHLIINAGVTPYSLGGGDLHVAGNFTVSTALNVNSHNVDVDGDFTSTSSTFSITDDTITVGGDISITNDTQFTDATLILDGCDQSTSTQLSFANVTKTVTDGAGPCNINLSATLFVDGGTLTLDGYDSTDRLVITSTTPGTRRNIDLRGIATFEGDYITVSDSNILRDGGSIGTTINPANSAEGTAGSTYGWFSRAIEWTGDSINGQWQSTGNWSPGIVPNTGDDVVIPSEADTGNTHPSLDQSRTIHDLTIEEDGELELNGFNLTVTGTLSHEGIITFDGSETVSFGTPDSNSGTCSYGGTVSRSITDCFHARILSTGTVTAAYDTVVQGNLTIDAGGTLLQNAENSYGYIDVLGDTLIEGTFDYSDENFRAGSHFGNITVGTAGSFRTGQTSSRHYEFNGDIVQNGGTITIDTENGGETIAGSLELNDGTFDCENDSAFTVTGNMTVAGGTIADAGSASFDVEGDFSHTSGTITLNSLGIDGDFTHSGGDFTVTNVNLSGCNQTINGSTTFTNLSKYVSSPCTLTIEAGTTQTVTDALTLYGDSNGSVRLTIVSSDPGEAATFDLDTATFNGDFLTISDNYILENGVRPDPLIAPASSAEGASGNTYGWFDIPIEWTGATGGAWNTASNWSPQRVPTDGDDVTIGDVATDPTLSGDVTVDDLTIEAGGHLTLDGNDLSVSGTFENDGALVLSSGTTTFPTDTNSGMCVLTGGPDNTLAYATFTQCFSVELAGSGNWSLNTNTTANGDFLITSGTWVAQNGPNTINGDLIIQGGTYDMYNQTAVSIGGDFSIDSGSFASSINTPGSVTIAGDFLLSGGTFGDNLAIKSFSVAGDVITSLGSSFGYSLDLTGCDQTVEGGLTFTTLSKTLADNDGNCTLTFEGNTTTTITSSLTLTGYDGDDILSIVSDDPDTAATIDLTSSSTISATYLTIADNTLLDHSSNITLPIDPTYSTNEGNTTGWFSPPDAPTDAPDLAAGSDSGSSSTDDITSDPTPTVTGSCTNGHTVRLYVDGASSSSITCSSSTYTLTTGSSLTGGSDYDLTVTFEDISGESDPSPALTITVDTTTPNTTIDDGPGTLTTDNTPTFTFSSDEGSATFECRIDAGSFSSCTSPFTTSTLSDGSHTIQIRATDAAGNVDATPASSSFTVDTVAPTTTITAGPSHPTIEQNPTFEFTSNDGSATFECNFDSGGYSTCTSPHTVTGIAVGAHTMLIRAIDAAGNADATPASHSFSRTSDSTPPTVSSVVRAGSSPTNATSVQFTVTFSEAVTGVGTADFDVTTTGTAAGSVASVSGSDDVYTVTVNSVSGDGTIRLDVLDDDTIVDAASNALNGPYSSGETYTIDTTSTTISSVTGPTNGSYGAGQHLDITVNTSENVIVNTTGGTPTIGLTVGIASRSATYASGNGTTVLVFRYTVQAGDTDSDGIALSSPLALNGGTLRDAASNNMTRTFTPPNTANVLVDTTAPNTTIDDGPGSLTTDNTPTFTFSSNEGSVTFECRIDAGSFSSCTSPFTTSSLSDGSHTVQIRATDAAGNVDATPASSTFTVDATVPTVSSVVRAGSSPTNATSVQFTVTFSEAVTGVGTADFDVTTTGTAAGTIASVSGSDTTYTVTVNSVSGDGTIRLDVLDDGSIEDASGNALDTAYSSGQAYTIDTTTPDTTIDTGPDDTTTDNTPTFTFSSDEIGATFECSIDGGSYAVCSSPFITSPLDAGDHTVSIRGVDAAGNRDASPATSSFTVEQQAPTVETENDASSVTTSRGGRRGSTSLPHHGASINPYGISDDTHATMNDTQRSRGRFCTATSPTMHGAPRTSVQYDDISPDAWYTDAVTSLTNAGIVQGDTNASGDPIGRFRGMNEAIPAEIVAMVLRARFGETDLPLANTPDTDAWKREYMRLARTYNLPTIRSSRGEVVALLLRSFCIDEESNTSSPYRDVAANHPHARAIARATELGIIRGDADRQRSFRPDDTVTRAELAVMIVRIMQLNADR